MSDIVWWVGAVHLAVYGICGTVFLITAVTVKAHMWAKVMGRVIQWQYARIRWERGEIDREPKP